MTRTRLIAVVVGVGLSWSAAAHADPVTDWNAFAVAAVSRPAPIGRPGPPGLLDLAVVHAAMHDAVQAIQGRFRPFHYSGTGSGSPGAAATAAAHRALVLIYPAQAAALTATYDAYVAAHGFAGDPGLAVGQAAAIVVFSGQYRPVVALPPYFGSTGIGEWRSPVPMAFLQLSFERPFTLNRIDQFRSPPPPPMNSVVYAREYDEVKAIGSAAAHTPGAPLTDLAWFWSGNYVAQWNETTRQLANGHLTDIGDSARLFALVNLAAADAAMAVWDTKYFYNFWRPSTAIQEGLYDGNPRTTGDGGWTPLFPNPFYADYVSGANGLTGAFTGMLRLFFGTDAMAFTVKTTAPPAIDKERDFSSFSQAAQEVVDARILLGIHFRSADEEGRRLGERVAHWTFQKYLRPTPGSK